jgi:hypothetical protein
MRAETRPGVDSVGDAIVLKIKQIISTLGIARLTRESPAAGFGGRAAAASILAPM